MALPVFAILVAAQADSDNEYPEGETRHVLVLVPADSPDEASSERWSLLLTSDDVKAG